MYLYSEFMTHFNLVNVLQVKYYFIEYNMFVVNISCFLYGAGTTYCVLYVCCRPRDMTRIV